MDETLNEQVEVNENQNYIDAINQIKQNSVERAKYEKLQQENKMLLDTLVSGKELNVETKKAPVDIKTLRNELFNPDAEFTNIQYVEKALELRDALIDAGEQDPFLAYGHKISPDASDYAAAENVAKVFRECIDYADGDSSLFTQELQRRTVDVGRTMRR